LRTEAVLKIQTTVLPGHRIEVATPDIPEGASVELLVYRLPDAPVDADRTALDAEYEALIAAQWQRELTEPEKQRLEEVKTALNSLAAPAGSPPFFDQQIAHIQQQLAAIRQLVEALPDAS
jgi:hypothetical protein